MAATALCLAQPAMAQAPPARDPTELDPSAPLDTMPDLGVDWPDLDSKDEPLAVSPEAPPAAAPAIVPLDTVDGGAELRYIVVLEGLEAIGASDALVAAFDKQSALRAKRKDPANAAQVDRRSRADAELLAELLRSQGYYDAEVEPRIDQAAGALTVVLAAVPGAQYEFQSVELPGLDAAGAEAAKLRAAFAVKPGDPVIAQDVIAAGIALKVALGEQGFALASVGDQDISIDHETHRAQLVLPVDTGPLAHFGALRVDG
ncbi:MAG: POTRA domain-containing protein, partial [Sphingomicrobium sp.]